MVGPTHRSLGAGQGPWVILDLEGLFRRYREDLLRFIRRRVSSPEVAADLAQEAFVRVMRHPQPQELRDPRAYLFTTAANLVLDHGRHQRLARTTDDALDDVPDTAPDSERVIAARQELALVQAALEKLPQRTRLAFEMHRLGGMSQPAIARQLGVSTTVVWRMVQDAYAQLRDALRDSGDGPGA